MEAVNKQIIGNFYAFFKCIEGQIGTKRYKERLHSASKFIVNGGKALYRGSSDKLFLYISLCISIIENNRKLYNPVEFARIYPVLMNVVTKWNFNKHIKNFEYKFTCLCSEANEDIDACLFEILTAFKYTELGFKVEIIKESPPLKTPDLFVEKRNVKYYVECKKMRRGNDYSYNELDKWYEISAQIAKFINTKKINGHIHFKFRSEIIGINGKSVVRKCLKILLKRNLQKPIRIVNNNDVKITFTPISADKFNVELDPLRFFSGPTFFEYLTGSYNYRYIYKTICEELYDGDGSTLGSYPYVSLIKWGTVLSCYSASRAAAAKKAQHLKRLLVDASKQLSPPKPGVVHILVEDFQDASVFENRYTKNKEVAENFLDKNDGLRYLFIHYAKYIAPLHKLFDVEETVQSFYIGNAAPKRFPQIWYPAAESSDGYGTLLQEY